MSTCRRSGFAIRTDAPTCCRRAPSDRSWKPRRFEAGPLGDEHSCERALAFSSRGERHDRAFDFVIDPRAAFALEIDQLEQRPRRARRRAEPDPAWHALALDQATRQQRLPRLAAVFEIPCGERAHDRPGFAHATIKSPSEALIPRLMVAA